MKSVLFFISRCSNPCSLCYDMFMGLYNCFKQGRTKRGAAIFFGPVHF